MSGRRKTASPRTMTTPESSSARASLRPPSTPPAMSTQSAANSDPDTTLWAWDLSLALAASISAALATFLACSTVTPASTRAASVAPMSSADTPVSSSEPPVIAAAQA